MVEPGLGAETFPAAGDELGSPRPLTIRVVREHEIPPVEWPIRSSGDGVGVFEVHQILLAKNGIYILENMNTAGLVADQAWEFMFVESHGRITGGVQAIINPIAIR